MTTITMLIGAFIAGLFVPAPYDELMKKFFRKIFKRAKDKIDDVAY